MSDPHPIRVLLVDDSRVVLQVLRRMLDTAPGLEVVGTADNGVEALRLIPRVTPDVLVTDLRMPGMDGLELVRQVIAQHPLPILVLSAWLESDDAPAALRLREAGALDIMAKPAGGLDADSTNAAEDLTRRIRILSGVKVIRAPKTPVSDLPAAATAPSPGSRQIVGMGASTGGPQALLRVLQALPADYPLPIVCVQHLAEGFVNGLVESLASSCRIRVTTAPEGTAVVGGTAYFAPDDRHIEVDADGRLRYSRRAPIAGHRPSVDVAFSSLALAYGSGAVGVLLTGMGQDGAEGLLTISRAGGVTIAQNEESSVVFGMPRQAIERGAVQQVLSLEGITRRLITIAGEHAPAIRGVA